MAINNISYPIIYPLSTRSEKGYTTKSISLSFVHYNVLFIRLSKILQEFVGNILRFLKNKYMYIFYSSKFVLYLYFSNYFYHPVLFMNKTGTMNNSKKSNSLKRELNSLLNLVLLADFFAALTRQVQSKNFIFARLSMVV